MLTQFLVFLHKRLKVKNSERFFNTAMLTLSILANISDVLVIILMSIFVSKVLAVVYAVTIAIAIRYKMGEHYDTWFECMVAGLLIYTMYAFVSMIINSVIVDIVLGFVLAVWMIDTRSDRFKKIKRRLKI